MAKTLREMSEHLRGPWLAVLADYDGYVYPTFEEARKGLPEEEEMTIRVVRDTAMPVDHGDPEDLRLPGSYNVGDLVFEIDAYLVDPDDESVGAEARYLQAQVMADGLNRATENRIPQRGDRYEWNGHAVEVTRVAGDATWADISVQPPTGPGWTKRQPLPFPPSWVAVDRG